jgi:hypothetical protein
VPSLDMRPLDDVIGMFENKYEADFVGFGAGPGVGPASDLPGLHPQRTN